MPGKLDDRGPESLGCLGGPEAVYIDSSKADVIAMMKEVRAELTAFESADKFVIAHDGFAHISL